MLAQIDTDQLKTIRDELGVSTAGPEKLRDIIDGTFPDLDTGFGAAADHLADQDQQGGTTTTSARAVRRSGRPPATSTPCSPACPGRQTATRHC